MIFRIIEYCLNVWREVPTRLSKFPLALNQYKFELASDLTQCKHVQTASHLSETYYNLLKVCFGRN